MALRAAVYDPRVTYVARRHITIGGRIYRQGDTVPRDGISERDYRGMFEKRKLVTAYDTPVAVAAVPTLDQRNGHANGANANANGNGHMADGVMPQPTPESGIVAGAKGWFSVYHGGKLVRRVRGEPAARQVLADAVAGNTAAVADAGDAASAGVSDGGADATEAETTAELETSGMDDTEPFSLTASDDDAVADYRGV